MSRTSTLARRAVGGDVHAELGDQVGRIFAAHEQARRAAVAVLCQP